MARINFVIEDMEDELGVGITRNMYADATFPETAEELTMAQEIAIQLNDAIEFMCVNRESAQKALEALEEMAKDSPIQPADMFTGQITPVTPDLLI